MKKMLLIQTAVLLTLAVPPLFGEQMLVNNDFKSGLQGWQTEGSGFTVSAGLDQWGSYADVAITNGGTNPWDVKLFQSGLTLEPGYEYVLEWGATRASGTISVGLGLGSEPYTEYMGDRISFSGGYVEHKESNGDAVTLHYCGESVGGLRFYADMGGSNAAARINWASIGKTAKACNGTDPGGQLTNPGNGPVPYYGELKVSGNRLVGARSKTAVQVRGMSLFWSVWGGEKFYNAAAVKTLVNDWNVEVVRAAMGVDVDGAYLDHPQDQVALVSAVVDAAIANEIYVIVDFHSHNAHQYASQAKTFFGEMARKYGKYDNVIFEVYNEPLAISWGTIKNYAEDVLTEIRKYSDNLVVVGTPNWSQDVDNVVSSRISDGNVAYTLHFYAGSHGSDLMGKARTAMNSGLALFVTEWGTVNANGDGGVATASTNDWMSFMDQYKLSWANWSANDKDEGASSFRNGISSTGSGWTDMNNLTASGQYVYSKLKSYAPKAPWRTAPKDNTPLLAVAKPMSFQVKRGEGMLEYYLESPAAHTATLTDVRGVAQWQGVQSSGNGIYRLGTANLRSGVYLLRVQGQNFTKSARIMIP